MKRAIYPGSFDPITKGHLDIIKRSAALFDEVIVVIMHNPDKKYLFSKEERLAMLVKSCNGLDNVSCDIGVGLSIHYARNHQAKIMIRGVRSIQDYAFELQTASANMWIDDTIETCFLLAKPEYSFLSSSSVKEIASYGESVVTMVDDYVNEELVKKYQNK